MAERGAPPLERGDEDVPALVELVLDTLLAVRRGERLLLVTDASGSEENGDIASGIVAGARDRGLEAILVETNDAPQVGAEHLPGAVARMMEASDVLISLTRTTAAPLPHHEVPLSLVRSGRLRGVFMAQRGRETLLGPSVLEPDFELMAGVASTWQRLFEPAAEVRIASELGTDFRASIEGMPSRRSDFAREPGTMSPVNWGEVYQGPVPGTAQGRLIVDGPILGFGWPEEPVAIEIEAGQAVEIEGDPRVAPALLDLVRNSENGANVAEVALGINPRADEAAINVFKKGLGRCHVALGSGLVYDQEIDSPIHIDCMLTAPTVWADETLVVERGKTVTPALDGAPRRRRS